jgi:hypothetical protein
VGGAHEAITTLTLADVSLDDAEKGAAPLVGAAPIRQELQSQAENEHEIPVWL